MKYPYIIFFRYAKYSDIDRIVLNNTNYNCTFYITDNISDLNKLFNPNYHLLITYGDAEKEYHNDILPNLINRFTDRWIHKTLQGIENIEEFNRTINYCYIHNVISKRSLQRPKFSIFTTCYNTWEKFDRVYNSLLTQKLKDWEWVILDDTPQNQTKNHFNFLKEKCRNDNRIRLYCRSENSGNIGNVKNEVVSLCRGKYLLELDHDDEILPDCLLDATEVFDKDDGVGFIYMDFANIYENGDNFKYSDFICKGYGGYYCQKYNDKWVNVYITPNINNITLSALVCCPNHPRIWRKDVLLELENYSEFLPICDDYEILLKTAINTKIVKINKLGYIQYMNKDNNNFSLIRNSEINRIGPHHIFPQFYDMYNVNEKMKQLSAHEDEMYINNHSQIWKRDGDYKHKYCNELVNKDYDKQYCIINDGIDNEELTELYKNPKNDFLFLSNKLSYDEIIAKLEEKGFDRMKCYTMLDASNKELKNYFNLLYANSNCTHEILDNKYNTYFNKIYNTRDEIINNIINNKQDINYLEIGVEYGATIKNINTLNKTAVDPDPKFENIGEFSNINLIKLTSDAYFANLDDIYKNNTIEEDHQFDIIFLDGMHQVEYIIKDIYNSLNYIKSDGKIFIDDILPIKEREQRKIPEKHYYENGILKYGESWTGDIWKVIYYLLLNFEENFDIKVYNNSHKYRGVLMLYNINKFNILINEQILEIINNYTYENDFNNYKSLLNKKSAIKLAFYTCFYGTNDNIACKIPEIPSLKYKCYYYTNNKTILEKLKITEWIGIYDNKPINDDVIKTNMDAKHIKCMPHEYNELKKYDYLCYLDSKLKKVSDIFVENFIGKYFIEQNYALLLRRHWYIHNKVWDEYNEGQKQNRYLLESDKYKEYIQNQVNNGLNEEVEHHCATGFIIRNMKHSQIKNINTTWYQHVQECGIQCQLSFFFVKQLFHEYIYPFSEEPFQCILKLDNLLYTVDNYNNQQSIKFFTYLPDKCIISKVISKNQIWETHMHRIFEKYINKESIVLEGGSHIGTHTLKLALLGKHVLSFEPMIKSNKILYNNIKINNIDNITLYSEGLSNAPGEAYFEWISNNNPGGSGLSNNPIGRPTWAPINYNKYPVKLITIDSLELNKLDFIKLDVEGYEINVIEGAINTIKRCNPIITMEIWEDFNNASVSLQYATSRFKILLDNGYTIKHIEGPDFLFLPPINLCN